MAEPVIEATRIAFTALTGTARRLKKLHDGMRDAPENIQWLTQDIQSVQIIVEYLEASINGSSDDFSDITRLVPFLQSCQAALENLDTLVQELSAEFCSNKWDRRAVARFEAAMKSEKLQYYGQRLQDTTRRLMLVQQAYTL